MFFQVLEKTANHYSLNEYAAMMAVNGFRGYMNEYMNEVLPKTKKSKSSSKTKRKKKDELVVSSPDHPFLHILLSLNFTLYASWSVCLVSYALWVGIFSPYEALDLFITGC